MNGCEFVYQHQHGMVLSSVSSHFISLFVQWIHTHFLRNLSAQMKVLKKFQEPMMMVHCLHRKNVSSPKVQLVKKYLFFNIYTPIPNTCRGMSVRFINFYRKLSLNVIHKCTAIPVSSSFAGLYIYKVPMQYAFACCRLIFLRKKIILLLTFLSSVYRLLTNV